MRSFHELSRREEGLTKSVRDTFGEASVGVFGIGIPVGKAPNGSRMRNVRKARRARDASSDAKDCSSSEDDMVGKVEDIIIEAQVPSTPSRPSSRIYLTTWDGYFDIDCSWVRESGMSKTTKDWWTLERDCRYPGYLPVDFPVYDSKTNSLSVGVTTKHFLSVLPPEVLHTAGAQMSIEQLMSYIATVDFNILRFLNALLHITGLEELGNDDVPFLHLGPPLSIETPPNVDRVPADDADLQSLVDVAVEDPTTPPRRRIRLIVSSSSSDESTQPVRDPAKRAAGLSFRGKPAYLVKEIRGERLKRGRTEYHVFWEGYASSEATWERASNVNKEAMDVWQNKKRKK